MSVDSVRHRHRVLLIDDYVPVAEAIERLLQLAGHTVSTRFNAENIAEHALAFRPDIVLLDIGLQRPDDGVSVARRLRAEPALRDVYLVALTGLVNFADSVDLASIGFDQHLLKPVGFDALEDTMRRAETHPHRGQGTMARHEDIVDHP